MNELGIKKLLSILQIGDELSVKRTGFNVEESYRGIVTDITETSVWIRNNEELGLFEAFTKNALEEIKLRDIWSYCITKETGEEIAV